MTRDVVASEDDLDGNPSLVTRASVEQTIDDCRHRGTNFTIEKTEDGWTPISKYSAFSNVGVQLQTLVDAQGHHKANEIYVIGQKAPGYVGAYVYWPIEHRLIYWLPDPHHPTDAQTLLVDWGDLDLDKGVRDKEDSNEYVYEMPRGYVKEIINACVLEGERFTIRKSS